MGSYGINIQCVQHESTSSCTTTRFRCLPHPNKHGQIFKYCYIFYYTGQFLVQAQVHRDAAEPEAGGVGPEREAEVVKPQPGTEGLEPEPEVEGVQKYVQPIYELEVEEGKIIS